MVICASCKDQTNKTRRNRPHEDLIKVDECRVFKGVSPRGYEEQDYQCRICRAKFTWSSNRNDCGWTVWQG